MSNERKIPVKIARQYVTPDSDMVAIVELNTLEAGGHILAVLVGNEGTNSRVKVGSVADSVFKTIPDEGSMDISYGVSAPYYFEDTMKIVFEANGASPVHKALIEIIVEKTC